MPYLLFLLFAAIAFGSRRREEGSALEDNGYTPPFQQIRSLYMGEWVQLKPQPREGWEGGAYKIKPLHSYAAVIVPPPSAAHVSAEDWGDSLERLIRWMPRVAMPPMSPEMQELLKHMPKLRTVLMATADTAGAFGPRSDQLPFYAIHPAGIGTPPIYVVGISDPNGGEQEIKASAFVVMYEAPLIGA